MALAATSGNDHGSFIRLRIVIRNHIFLFIFIDSLIRPGPDSRRKAVRGAPALELAVISIMMKPMICIISVVC